MSESKQTCPHCGRAPGSAHTDDCPRSHAARHAMDYRLHAASHEKVIWAKGQQVSKLTGETLVNPGIPLVKEGKPWYAGGVPAFMRRK